MPSRRSVLSLTTGVFVAFAGCSSLRAVTPPKPRTSSEGEARGEAPAITLDPQSTDSESTYVPSNDTVRYPATESGGEVDSYRHVSFARWSRAEAASIAVRAVRERLERRFDDLHLVSVGIGGLESGTLGVAVGYRVETNESGVVVDRPDASVSALLAAVPRTVTATVELAGKTATHDVPVAVAWGSGVPLAEREDE